MDYKTGFFMLCIRRARPLIATLARYFKFMPQNERWRQEQSVAASAIVVAASAIVVAAIWCVRRADSTNVADGSEGDIPARRRSGPPDAEGRRLSSESRVRTLGRTAHGAEALQGLKVGSNRSCQPSSRQGSTQ